MVRCQSLEALSCERIKPLFRKPSCMGSFFSETFGICHRGTCTKSAAQLSAAGANQSLFGDHSQYALFVR